VLDRLAGLRVAVGAAEVEEVVIEERENVVGRPTAARSPPNASPRPEAGASLGAPVLHLVPQHADFTTRCVL